MNEKKQDINENEAVETFLTPPNPEQFEDMPLFPIERNWRFPSKNLAALFAFLSPTLKKIANEYPLTRTEWVLSRRHIAMLLAWIPAIVCTNIIAVVAALGINFFFIGSSLTLIKLKHLYDRKQKPLDGNAIRISSIKEK